MAATNKQNIGLRGELSRRPSHVPNDETKSGDAKVMNWMRQQGHRRRPNLPIKRPPPQHSKGNQRVPQWPTIPNYPPPQASGMQAFFLDTRQNSQGTGFFFPRNDKKSFPSKKSGSHVGLVHLREIEALNRNGHTLGPKTADHQDNNNKNVKDDGHGDSIKCNEGNEKSTRLSLSQIEHMSPEIFLPKEWTY